MKSRFRFVSSRGSVLVASIMGGFVLLGGQAKAALILAGGLATAVGVDFEDGPAVALNAARVDVDDRGTASEAFGGVGDDLGIDDGGGVDADLFGAGLDQGRDVLDGPDAASDGEGHEALLGDLTDDIEHDLAVFMARGDVEEDQFVGPGAVVLPGNFHGIARIAEGDKVHAFDHAAGFDVEARNNSMG